MLELFELSRLERQRRASAVTLSLSDLMNRAVENFGIFRGEKGVEAVIGQRVIGINLKGLIYCPL